MTRVEPSWHTVEVVAAVGTEFGVISDKDGKLILVVREQGEPWPHGLAPQKGTRNTIAMDYTRYVVTDGASGGA